MTAKYLLTSLFVFVNLCVFMILNAKILTGADAQQIMSEGNPYIAIPLLVIVSLIVSFSRYSR